MEIEKTLHLAAPPAQVWALLLDPQAMAACVPGMQSVEIVGPDEYTALMQVKIAFVSARFRLRTRIVQRDEPHYLKAEGTGEDAAVASSLKQTTEVFLEAAAEGGTGLRLKVHVDVLGRIGSFGLSAMKTKADRLWDEFGVKLAERMRQLARALGAVGIGVAEQRSVGFARDNLDVTVLRGGVFDHVGQQQRLVHHQTGLKHGVLLRV